MSSPISSSAVADDGRFEGDFGGDSGFAGKSVGGTLWRVKSKFSAV